MLTKYLDDQIVATHKRKICPYFLVDKPNICGYAQEYYCSESLAQTYEGNQSTIPCIIWVNFARLI